MNNLLTKMPDSFRADIERAIGILKKYGCSEIYIFGSLTNNDFNDESDIDIAIKGIKPELFFRAYSDLMFELEHSVDFINMETQKRFINFLTEIKEIVRVA